MESEWDGAKRLSNLAKRGLDFVDVDRFDWTAIKGIRDMRFNYGEDRYRAYEMLNGQLYSIAFTLRGPVVRILSFRPANRLERKSHGA
jgi:uncharacterized DUF497 family protein